MKPNLLTEPQIQQQIIGYLRFKGYYVQRLNSGMLPMGEGRSRRMVRMNRAGTPDIMAFKTVSRLYKEHAAVVSGIDLLFVEVKRPGNKPTAAQQAVMEELESFGARCIVATSVEDVEAVL